MEKLSDKIIGELTKNKEAFIFEELQPYFKDGKVIQKVRLRLAEIEDFKNLANEKFEEFIKQLKDKEDIEFESLMETICEFALFESTGVWDSKKIFGNKKPNIRFIGDKIIEISKIKDKLAGDKLT